MKRLLFIGVTLAAGLLQGCGGGSNSLADGPGGPGGAGAGVATVEVTASSATLGSSADGSTSVQIVAQARDAGNVALEGVPVTWLTDSGQFLTTQGTTDANGVAIAELSNGTDPTNRPITVTVNAGGQTQAVTVDVIGTTLTINGPPALALNDSGIYTISLRDSLLQGVPNITVNLTSVTGNSLPASVVTPPDGSDAQVSIMAVASGADTITATALGLAATTPINVSDDIFSILTPLEGEELPVLAPQDITVQWIQGGLPQAGENIIFTSTRGTLTSSIGITDAAGEATVQVTSDSAGPTIITATNPDGTTTTVDAEFVATTADSIELQANPLTVTVGTTSTLTAIVRDNNSVPNLVKNKVVVFQILQDSTGGFLTVGAAVTDSQGVAQSAYTAGTVASSVGGVQVRAFVQEVPPLVPAVENQVNLTVVGPAIDLSIGTGSTIFIPTTALYAQEWNIIATDTSGTAPALVSNTTIQASIRSVGFRKGSMSLYDPGTGDLAWAPVFPPPVPPALGTPGYAEAFCPDEDVNRDGFLAPGMPPAGEDNDGDGVLEAGNRATLAALAPTAPVDACGSIGSLGGPTTSVQTDANGIARVCVIYPQSDNLWVDVEIRGLLNVFGTEFQEARQFLLLALAEDLNDENSDPSGRVSPFGTQVGCNNPL